MLNKISIQYYKSPLGELMIGVFNQKLCICDWRYRSLRTTIDNRVKSILNASFVEEKHELIDETIKQLNEYFLESRREFNIPLIVAGSSFQELVWQQLLKIGYGETVSYLVLAQKINKPEAVRAVAAANGANAISVIIPCHRVIGSNGELTGYAGGLIAKKKLLQMEGVSVKEENKQQTSLEL